MDHRPPRPAARGVALAALAVVTWLAAADPARAAAPAAGAAAADVRPLTPDDWYGHEGPEQQFTEFWTAIVQSDDGWIVYASLLRTNLGLGSGNAGVAISVTAPDGTVTRDKVRFEASELVEDRAAGTLTLRDQQLTFGVDGGVRLRVALAAATLDVTLTPWTDGYKFGDGRRVVSAAQGWFMQYVFLVPRADVRGTLTVGDRAVPLTGAGYLDHMHTNRALTFWSRRWYVLTAFGPDATVHYNEGFPLEGFEDLHGRLGWLVVVDRGGVRFASAAPRLRFRNPAPGQEGCGWPTEFVLTAEEGADRVRVAWRTAALHDAYLVLDQLPAFLRQLVAGILGNPVFFRFTDRYDATLTLDGKPQRLRGRGLHQVVCLHPDP